MGKRSTSRRLAMQALYECDISSIEPDQALENVFNTDDFIEATKEFAAELVKGTWTNKEQIDQLISQHTKGWKIERISLVDRNILRLAIYEIKIEQNNPPAVIINEAVELAKKFGGEDSHRFVNGILGKLV